ncbi:MAG: oxidoreductase [Anaerococcus sp.]
MAKKNNAKKTLKKQKYNIIVSVFAFLIVLSLIGVLTSFIKNRKIAKYDEEIIVLKANDSEIDSVSLKELRKGESASVNIYLNNQEKKTTLEGVSLEKVINNLKIDTTKFTKLETKNKNGTKSSISIDTALEPDRVYLVYKLNSQAIYDYNNSFGYFAIIDSQSKDSSDWILDVREINLK